jgi:hypothetical protein
MRYFILLLFVQTLISQSYSQGYSTKSNKNVCEELKAVIEQIEKNQEQKTTAKEIKKIDSLTTMCQSKKLKCLAYRNLLKREFNLGSYSQIENLLNKYEKSFSPVLSMNDSIHLSSYYLFKAANLTRLNKLSKATNYIDKGINLAILTKDLHNEKNGYIMLSVLFGQIQDHKKSIIYTKKAMNLNKESSSFIAYGDLLIGISFKQLTEFDSAIFYFNSSTLKYKKIGDIVSANYSKSYVYKTNQEKFISNPDTFVALYSEKELVEFLKDLEKDNNPYALLNIHLVMANYYLIEKQYEKSEKHAKEGYKLAQYIENDLTISAASEAILSAVLSKQDPSNIRYLKQFRLSSNEQYNSENAKATLILREKYDAQEKENDLLEEKNKNLSYKLYAQYTIVVILLLAVILFGIIRFRIKKKNDEVVRLQKHAMQVQMNPHFIFNSLNSINNFISTNNSENAQYYLTKFAKLMRLALKSSQEETITVKDELQFLEGYLSLEKARNENFDYSFEVNDELSELQIPPLLIQPIIENSIIHGFKKLPHKGKLIISITKAKNSISVDILDNGWGIQIQNDKREHKSFATQIQRDRLKLYSKEYNEISYSNGIEGFETLGTRVSFNLPVLTN